MSRVLIVMLAWWLSAGAVHAAGSTFSSPYRLSLAWRATYDVAIGDVNGDGRKDLVVPTRQGYGWRYTLSIYLQGADGRLGAPVSVALPETTAVQYRIALADLDGDGAMEVVTGTPAAAGVYVVRMTSARTASLVEHPGPASSCWFVVAGDIDRDGNPDVLCHDQRMTAVAYIGNGRGGFRTTRTIPTLAGWYTPFEDFKTLQLADATGDGYLDLLISSANTSAFHVMANNRMGGFFAGAAYPHPPSRGEWRSSAIHAADIDGDGISEVLTATPDFRPYAALNVYRRAPNGFLSLSDRIPVHHLPTAILSGKAGPDAGVKVMLGHYSYSALSVLGEDGGDLRSQFLYELPGFGNHIDVEETARQYSIALGDLDGDGCDDLAGATYSGVTILYGCETFQPTLPAGDFDGDGVSDLLWYHASADQHLWPMADETAGFECRMMIPCPGALGRQMLAQVGDFDGDGSSDVFWRDPLTGENLVTLGAFDPYWATTVSNLDWQPVGTGDFDNDDRADLLWRNRRTGANVIWRSAEYKSQQAVRTVADARWQVAGVDDFDGDRRADILWRHAATGANVIWKSGNHATQQSLVTVNDQGWTVVGTGDFDGDGRADIVWRHAGSGANAIWKAGNHRAQLPVTRVSDPLWRIAAVGDYNGDGLSDLVWRRAASGKSVIWLSGDSRKQKPLASMHSDWEIVR